MKQRKSRWLIQSIWLQGTLLALLAVTLWWLRKRREHTSEQRTEIWRRDVEMGPTPTSQEALMATAEIEIPAERETEIPDLGAGDGGQVELANRAESIDLSEAAVEVPLAEVPVEGPVPEAETQPLETPGGDDLEIIEGIGPKINQILQAAGIRTFKQLAETEVSVLEKILREVGLRIANPSTWPEQARLAAEGEWSKLDAYQATLKAGRRG